MINLEKIEIKGRVIKHGNSYYISVGKRLVDTKILSVGQRITAEIKEIENAFCQRWTGNVKTMQSKICALFKKLSESGKE